MEDYDVAAVVSRQRCGELVSQHVLTRLEALAHRTLFNPKGLRHERLKEIEGEDGERHRLHDLYGKSSEAHLAEYRWRRVRG